MGRNTLVDSALSVLNNIFSIIFLSGCSNFLHKNNYDQFFIIQDCVCTLKKALKKCHQEKSQLEKVIIYLKDEMQLLSEQLVNLQQILVI